MRWNSTFHGARVAFGLVEEGEETIRFEVADATDRTGARALPGSKILRAESAKGDSMKLYVKTDDVLRA